VISWAADSDTTYTTSWVDSSNDAILRLTPSSGSVDDLTIVAGSNITLTPSGDNLTIAAAGGANTALSNLASVAVNVDIFTANNTGIIIGHTAQIALGNVTGELQVLGDDESDSTIVIGQFKNAGLGASLCFVRSRSTTIGTSERVQTNDVVGEISWHGADSTDFGPSLAAIRGVCEDTAQDNDTPGRLEFLTTSDGAEAPTIRMAIASTGVVTVTGNILPGANNTYDLGSSSYQWQNIYTQDFHLNNTLRDEGNSIDGTKGNWTIQEGDENLFIVNNKTGKKYKFHLTEVA
jgi:hypothetical protein